MTISATTPRTASTTLVSGEPAGIRAIGLTKSYDTVQAVRGVLRITPLRVRTDCVAKMLAAYLVALPALGLVFLAGATLGVRLDAAQWFDMTGLLLIGLVPFILMGLILGHVIATDALVQVMGWLVVFFALFGGAFGSLFNSGAMLTVVKLLPSYWLVHAGEAALIRGDWPMEAWIVLACWTAALIPLAVVAYRHDTGEA